MKRWVKYYTVEVRAKKKSKCTQKKSFTRVNNHSKSCDMLSLLGVIRAHIALFNCINCKKIATKEKVYNSELHDCFAKQLARSCSSAKKFFFPFVILKLIYQSQSEVKVKRNFPKTFHAELGSFSN